MCAFFLSMELGHVDIRQDLDRIEFLDLDTRNVRKIFLARVLSLVLSYCSL